MGAPFRHVAPPFRWEMVLGSYLGVEDHHPRDHTRCRWIDRCVVVVRPIQDVLALGCGLGVDWAVDWAVVWAVDGDVWIGCGLGVD